MKKKKNEKDIYIVRLREKKKSPTTFFSLWRVCVLIPKLLLLLINTPLRESVYAERGNHKEIFVIFFPHI